MKKKLWGIFICVLLMYSFGIQTYASNQVSSIDIDATIYNDGSIYVVQVWDGTFNDGTENYIPMNAPDYLTISNLIVSDINGTYETIEQWDINAGFDEKSNKCGINYTDNGYEICFGISEYGEHRYAIEYKLDNVIGCYTDFDGANFRFVNDGMNTTPTDVNVEILFADGTPITDEIADIWGFGFEGQVEFADGAIRAYTEVPISADNNVTVMFSFNKGVLYPKRIENDSFETIKARAFDGSDYDTNNGEEVSGFTAMLIVIAIIAVAIVLIISIIMLKKRLKLRKLNKLSSKFGYFRSIPNSGNINGTYELGRLFELCDDGAILATGILRLMDLGCISPISLENVGFMGRTKEIVNLRLIDSNNGRMNEYDEYLYTVLESAAGPDGILQANELEKFADKNDMILRNYIGRCEDYGMKYLNQKHCIKRFDTPFKLKYLTPNGEKELGELIGFKKYLEDFSLITERGIKEMPIWKELLSYAMLFGIADKVAEQMKALYPNIASEVTSYNESLYTAYSYHYLIYQNMRNAEERREQLARNGGSGGFSSIGGGGGSIGGGTGGGSR